MGEGSSFEWIDSMGATLAPVFPTLDINKEAWVVNVKEEQREGRGTLDLTFVLQGAQTTKVEHHRVLKIAWKVHEEGKA